MPISARKSAARSAAFDAATPARRRFSAKDLALVASFAALIVVLGFAGAIPIAGLAVPITLQTLGVMLAGAVLGWRRGAAAVLLVLGLCALGLPVLSGGRGGIGVFAGASAGYLLGWIFGAATIGALVQLWGARRGPVAIAAACVIGGIGVVYLFGIPILALRTGTSLPVAALANVSFLPGDLIKVAIATVVAGVVHRANPELLPSRRG